MVHRFKSSCEQATDVWSRLSSLTGRPANVVNTGWDQFFKVVLDDPSLSLRVDGRIGGIARLVDLISTLSEAQLTVVALRFGLTVDDRPLVARSRREISEHLQLSVSRIAQLEREAIQALRQRAIADASH